MHSLLLVVLVVVVVVVVVVVLVVLVVLVVVGCWLLVVGCCCSCFLSFLVLRLASVWSRCHIGAHPSATLFSLFGPNSAACGAFHPLD